MKATVGEVRRLFGPSRGETSNLPPFGDIYPGRAAPVLRRENGALSLDVCGPVHAEEPQRLAVIDAVAI